MQNGPDCDTDSLLLSIVNHLSAQYCLKSQKIYIRILHEIETNETATS